MTVQRIRAGRNLRRLFLVFVLGTLGFHDWVVGAEAISGPPERSYTVQGFLTQQDIRFSTEKQFYYDVSTINFELFVSGCRWFVKLETDNPRLYDYRIVSSDGENTYLLLSYETRQKLSPKPLANLGDGAITRGKTPGFTIAEEAGALWLAYASGCAFAEHPGDDRQIVPFVSYVRGQPILPGQTLAVEHANRVLSDRPPYLPTQVEYYMTNLAAEYFNTTGTTNGRIFSNVVYQAISFIDVEDLRLPKEAVVTVYRPHPHQKTDLTIQLCQEIRLTATNVLAGVKLASFKPSFPGTTVISEGRFDYGSGIHFSYFATNSWPDESIVTNFRAYKEAVTTRRDTQAPQSGSRPVLVALMLVVFALPVVVLVFKSRARGTGSRQMETNKQTNIKK